MRSQITRPKVLLMSAVLKVRAMSHLPSAARFSVILLALAGFFAPQAGAQTRPNVLIIIADDLGVGEVGVYGPTVCSPTVCSSPGPTPVLDQLAANGVRFKRAWSNPACSPTRATLYTGRYSMRTGVGTAILDPNPTGAGELADTEFTLPAALTAIGYKSALIGKWHLGTSVYGDFSPLDVGGFNFHAGVLTGVLTSYNRWNRTVTDDQLGTTITNMDRTYATTQNVDDAVTWIGTQTGPWMLTLAFNAPHEPYHLPPRRLLSQATRQALQAAGVNNNSDCRLNNQRLCYQAAIEAMDTEIGRLFVQGGISLSDTFIIFLGDNGTPGDVTVPPFDPNRAKATVNEGGIRVPLIIAGPSVVSPGRVVNDPVNTTDIFPTISSVTGAANPNGTDWVSLFPYLDNTAVLPLRAYVYSEFFDAGTDPHNDPEGDGTAAIFDGMFKVIESGGVLTECYDLSSDEYETINLWDPLNPRSECQTLYDTMGADLHNCQSPHLCP